MSGHTPCQATDKLTTSTAVVAGRQFFRGVNINTDGTNTATITIYDNATAASGKIIGTFVCPGATLNKDVIFNEPVRVYNGIYAAVAGTGASCNVYFSD